MEYSCPDCAAPLNVVAANGTRTLDCPSCRGRLYGLSPFERMLAEGVGMRIWTGAADGAPAGPCPYCSAAMNRPDADPDVPSGLSVCRRCQEVWVPASAAVWVSTHAAAGSPGGGAVAGGPGAAVLPADCPNCGAPFQPDDEGRCHWCHTQIGPPQPVVVFVQPDPEPLGGFRLI